MTFSKSVKSAVDRFIRDHMNYVKNKRADLIVYLIIHVLCIAVFLYGVIFMIPIIFENSSSLTYAVANLVATFILFGVFANLQFIRINNSAITNRLLIRPENDTAEIERITRGTGNGDGVYTRGVDDGYRGNKIDSEAAWHICAVCETFVPPRTWHCDICKTCILRRDHHCIFAMRCVGEDNQAHFLGFILYLCLGTFYATTLGYIYNIYYQETSVWWWLLKSVMLLYVLFLEFSLLSVLTSLSFVGFVTSFCMFGYYLALASKGQTAADSSRNISRKSAGKSTYSYENLVAFVGPNPILRMLWPFIPPVHKSYDSTRKEPGYPGTSKDY